MLMYCFQWISWTLSYLDILKFIKSICLVTCRIVITARSKCLIVGRDSEIKIMGISEFTEALICVDQLRKRSYLTSNALRQRTFRPYNTFSIFVRIRTRNCILSPCIVNILSLLSKIGLAMIKSCGLVSQNGDYTASEFAFQLSNTWSHHRECHDRESSSSIMYITENGHYSHLM